MKLFWLIVAGICILAAAFFLWQRDLNTAFVIAVVGIVAWFLNYRAQMKEIVASADLEKSKLDDGRDWEDSDDD